MTSTTKYCGICVCECVSAVFDGIDVFVCVSVSIWLRQWSWKKLSHAFVSFLHVLFFKYSDSSICILNYNLIFIKLFVHSLLHSLFFVLSSSYSFSWFLCRSDMHLISLPIFDIVLICALVKNEWHRQRTWTVQRIKTIDWLDMIHLEWLFRVRHLSMRFFLKTMHFQDTDSFYPLAIEIFVTQIPIEMPYRLWVAENCGKFQYT